MLWRVCRSVFRRHRYRPEVLRRRVRPCDFGIGMRSRWRARVSSSVALLTDADTAQFAFDAPKIAECGFADPWEDLMRIRTARAAMTLAVVMVVASAHASAATLFADGFEAGAAQWTPTSGAWSVCDDPPGHRYCQSDPAFVPPMT